MRDKLKNQKYYNEFFDETLKTLAFYSQSLKDNQVNIERINHVISQQSKYSLQLLIAKYSAGYPIEDLYPDYYEAVNYMRKSWMALDKRACYLNDVTYNHYFCTDYNFMLWMLAIGYLLDVEENEFLKLVEVETG